MLGSFYLLIGSSPCATIDAIRGGAAWRHTSSASTTPSTGTTASAGTNTDGWRLGCIGACQHLGLRLQKSFHRQCKLFLAGNKMASGVFNAGGSNELLCESDSKTMHTATQGV